jgi:hypothetical protein
MRDGFLKTFVLSKKGTSHVTRSSCRKCKLAHLKKNDVSKIIRNVDLESVKKLIQTFFECIKTCDPDLSLIPGINTRDWVASLALNDKQKQKLACYLMASLIESELEEEFDDKHAYSKLLLDISRNVFTLKRTRARRASDMNTRKKPKVDVREDEEEEGVEIGQEDAGEESGGEEIGQEADARESGEVEIGRDESDEEEDGDGEEEGVEIGRESSGEEEVEIGQEESDRDDEEEGVEEEEVEIGQAESDEEEGVDGEEEGAGDDEEEGVEEEEVEIGQGESDKEEVESGREESDEEEGVDGEGAGDDEEEGVDGEEEGVEIGRESGGEEEVEIGQEEADGVEIGQKPGSEERDENGRGQESDIEPSVVEPTSSLINRKQVMTETITRTMVVTEQAKTKRVTVGVAGNQKVVTEQANTKRVTVAVAGNQKVQKIFKEIEQTTLTDLVMEKPNSKVKKQLQSNFHFDSLSNKIQKMKDEDVIKHWTHRFSTMEKMGIYGQSLCHVRAVHVLAEIDGITGQLDGEQLEKYAVLAGLASRKQAREDVDYQSIKKKSTASANYYFAAARVSFIQGVVSMLADGLGLRSEALDNAVEYMLAPFTFTEMREKSIRETFHDAMLQWLKTNKDFDETKVL